MKRYLLLLLVFKCFGQAPSIEWQRCFGGTSYDNGFCVIETTDGGYAFVGETFSNNGNVSLNNGSADIWVVKTNSTGEILWEKTFGGSSDESGYDIKQTSDGGYVITGETLSNDNDFTVNHGLKDVFVIKLNSDGTVIWKKCYGGTSREYGQEIQQTTDGGYIVFGRTTSEDGNIATSLGNYDFWLIKLDAEGNLMWENVYGGSFDDMGMSVKQTSDNGYVIAGYTNSLDGHSLGNHSAFYDCLVLKLDQAGNVVWNKLIGGTVSDYCYSIIETADGGFVGAGYSDSNDGDITTNNGNFDALAFKLTATGNLIWLKTFGDILDELFIDVKEIANNKLLFSGVFNGFSVPVGNSHSWVTKLDSNGDLVWDKKVGGSNFDFFYKSAFTSNNSIISIGYTTSNDVDVSGNHGSRDIWVVKFLPEQMSTTTFEKNALVIYPNPSSEIITIGLNELAIQKIKIIDCIGKTIMEQMGNYNQINVKNLSDGMYFLQVIAENNLYETKFIKQ